MPWDITNNNSSDMKNKTAIVFRIRKIQEQLDELKKRKGCEIETARLAGAKEALIWVGANDIQKNKLMYNFVFKAQS